MKDSFFLAAKDAKEAPLSKIPSTFPTRIDESLALGLDLGVGTCGQALVYDTEEAKAACRIAGLPAFPGRIAFMGVRAFDAPEVREKTGIKLKNPERRQKRQMRKTIRRRASRLWSIRRLFKSYGLLPEDYPTNREIWKKNPQRGENLALDKWRDWHARMTEGAAGPGRPGPLEFRVRGLDQRLDPLDWAAALLHLAKHRGFKSNRKSEALEEEGGKVLTALAQNSIRMEAGSYRTFGEMLLMHPDFAQRKRNREGSFTSTALRADQELEIHILFARQRDLGNPQASAELEAAFVKRFTEQKPLQNSITLVGTCPFEKGESRGPRYAPSFELCRALQKLNALSIILQDQGKVRLADYVCASGGGYDEFIRTFATRGTQSEPGRISWADVRSIFDLPDNAFFADLPLPKRSTSRDGTEKIQTTAELEREDFVTRNNRNAAAKGSYLLRNAVGGDLWNELSNTVPEQLDQTALALTFCEEIENEFVQPEYWGVLNQMRHDQLDSRLIAAVEKDLKSDKPTLAGFRGATSMSTLASRGLLPLLRTGVVYSDACSAIYGDHRQTDFAFESITNPVVKSVVRECLKQVVHLIDQTGSLPGRVCVELGRDLGKSIDERNEMHKGISDRTTARNANRTVLEGHLGRVPDDDELLRYELWLEQSHTCIYCGGQLGKPVEIVTPEFEVDHILPRSRSHDNSYENKVLVHRKCNRDKNNCTPFEFSQVGNGDLQSEGWLRFTAIVTALKGIRKQKRRNLLNSTFAEDEARFASRHLNDTRYIARLVTRYLEALYEMAGERPASEMGGTRRVFVQPGALTALVRKAWGLENLKKDVSGDRVGDKHHAVDALVCALLSEGQRQLITRIEQKNTRAARDAAIFRDFSNAYALMERKNDHRRTPHGVQPPWNGFRQDVVRAVDLFTVSRREIRKGRGGLHNDTIYRVGSENGQQVCYLRKSIVDSTTGKRKAIFGAIGDLEKVKDIHAECNAWLKKALTIWIQAGCPVEPENLPRDPQGAVIRKVTLLQGKKSGRPYPQGYVVGGNQIRLDVFSKVELNGILNYYLVPVYSHHLIQPGPPFRAVIANVHEESWDRMDESFNFEFSLWPNSRFEIKKRPTKKKPNGEHVKGLYVGIDRNTGAFVYCDPDDSQIQGRLSAKSGTLLFRKVQIDRLGREYPIPNEKRTWRGKTVS